MDACLIFWGIKFFCSQAERSPCQTENIRCQTERSPCLIERTPCQTERSPCLIECTPCQTERSRSLTYAVIYKVSNAAIL